MSPIFFVLLGESALWVHTKFLQKTVSRENALYSSMSGFINCPSWKIGFAAYDLQQHQRAQRVSKWSDPITPRLFQTNVSKNKQKGGIFTVSG